MNNYYSKTNIVKYDDFGEVIADKSTIRKFYNPFKDGQGYNFKYKSIKIESYLDIELPKDFTDSECGKIYRLSRYIYSDSNMLAKRSNGKIISLNKEDIRGIITLHRTKFVPFWKKVVNKKIIKSILIDGSEYYCFNPIYYNSTTYLPLYLYIAFQDELNLHLPEWVISKYLDMQPSTKESDKCLKKV